MKTKILSIFLSLMTLVSINAKADELTLSDVDAVKGKTAVLYVNMSNSESINALSFDLTLPSGVTIVQSNGEYSVDFVAGRKPAGGSVTCGDPVGGKYTIAEFSTSNGTFKGTSGAILTITLNVSSNISIGNSDILLSNAFIVNSANQEKPVADAKAILKVKEVSSTPTVAKLISVSNAKAADIPAYGGQSRAEATVEYNVWTRTIYSDGSHEDGSASTKTMTIYGNYVSAYNLATEVTDRRKVGSSTASGIIEGYTDENGNTISASASPIDIYQEANYICSFDDVEVRFADDKNVITIPAGGEFDLDKIISVSQETTYSSGEKVGADVSVYYSVLKSPEGFNPLSITENTAVVSIQSTADATLAKGFTVRVLALGKGSKVAVSDVEFSASQTSDVKALHIGAASGKVYDLTGRIVNISEGSKGVLIQDGKKTIR